MKKREKSSDFSAAHEQNGYYLEKFDLWTKRLLVPRIPTWISTAHLTLATLPFALGTVLAAAFFGKGYLPWLCLFIIAHHFTDLLDGAVGRYRKTGLLRWGYYMDKLVDFIFVNSVSASLAIAYPEFRLLAILPAFFYGAILLQSILFYASTGIPEKTYGKFSPTEVKVAIVALILGMIIFGDQWMKTVLFAVDIMLFSALSLIVYRSHRYLWKLDMRLKEGLTEN